MSSSLFAKGGEGGADVGAEMEGAGNESVRERVGGGVEPGVTGGGTAEGHLPEGKLEDAGRVLAAAEVEEESAGAFGAGEEIAVAGGSHINSLLVTALG